MLLNHKQLGEGPPLVILHGLFGSLDNWMSLAKSLSRQWRVYLVDLRNHGKSFHHHEFNYPAMSKDLNRWAEQEGLSKFHLIGHSMGGKVAMFYALDHPASLDKLVVIDIGPKKYPVQHQMIINGLSSIDPGQLSNRQEANSRLAKYINEEPIRQLLLKNLQRNQHGGFNWKFNLPAISTNIEMVGAALSGNRAIATDTLFIRGGESSYILDEDLTLIKERFPRYKVITIEQAGHWVHAEQPARTLEAITDFLGTANLI